jgi:hypothetical protein
MLRDDRLRGDEHKGVFDKPLHVVARLALDPLERVQRRLNSKGRRNCAMGSAQTLKPCAFCSMNTAFHCSYRKPARLQSSVQ